MLDLMELMESKAKLDSMEPREKQETKGSQVTILSRETRVTSERRGLWVSSQELLIG